MLNYMSSDTSLVSLPFSVVQNSNAGSPQLAYEVRFPQGGFLVAEVFRDGDGFVASFPEFDLFGAGSTSRAAVEDLASALLTDLEWLAASKDTLGIELRHHFRALRFAVTP